MVLGQGPGGFSQMYRFSSNHPPALCLVFCCLCMLMLAAFSGVSQCTQCALYSQDELSTLAAVLCVVQKGEALTPLPGATRVSGTVSVLLVVAPMDSMDTDYP